MPDDFKERNTDNEEFQQYREDVQKQLHLPDDKKKQFAAELKELRFEPVTCGEPSGTEDAREDGSAKPYFPSAESDAADDHAGPFQKSGSRRLWQWGGLAAGFVLVTAAILLIRPLSGFKAAQTSDGSEAGSEAQILNTQSSEPFPTTFASTTASTTAIPTIVSTLAQTSGTRNFKPAEFLSIEELKHRCLNFNYNCEIMKSLVEGTISPADLSRLKAEIPYYDNINDMAESSTFRADLPGVIGDAIAAAKAKEYVKAIFGYDIPANVSPQFIRCDYTKCARNEYLKWDTYYQVYFEMRNPSADCAKLFYGINIDAKSGKCIGCNFGKDTSPNTDIYYKKLTDGVVSEMQERAAKFVVGKNLVPGSHCVYVYSDLSIFGDVPDPSSELQTEIYMDNGTIVDVHEGFKEGNRLYYNIFPSHGLK